MVPKLTLGSSDKFLGLTRVNAPYDDLLRARAATRSQPGRSGCRPNPRPLPRSPVSTTDEARALLRRFGADRTPHPGGTLLTHLERVRIQLALWDARPALQLAGLCHAFYGTDGFPTALLPLDRRTELASVIGPDAEAIVHFYASCDRGATYPHLLEPRFRDRFTGRTYAPDLVLRRNF